MKTNDEKYRDIRRIAKDVRFAVEESFTESETRLVMIWDGVHDYVTIHHKGYVEYNKRYIEGKKILLNKWIPILWGKYYGEERTDKETEGSGETPGNE